MTPEEFIKSIKHRLLQKYDVNPDTDVRLKLSEKTMKPYRDNNPIGIVDTVHSHLRVLENEGLVQLKWRTPDLIQYITLKEPKKIAESIDYELLSDKSDNAANHVRRALAKSYHYELLALDIEKSWSEKGRYQGFSVDDPKLLIEAVRAADALRWRNQSEALEIDERHFSSSVFSDSKRFSKIGSRVSKILKLANPMFDDMETDELFRYHGVVPIKHPVFISGPVVIYATEGESITAEFPPSVGVWTDYISNIKGNIKILTTIENMATFNRYVQMEERTESEAVLYTAGIPSPAIRKVYSLLVSLNPEIVRHWSDIDLGGFTVLNILEKTAERPVAAYRMSYDDYMNVESVSELTEKQSVKLSKLAKHLSHENRLLANVVANKKKTFEQESYMDYF